MSDFKDMLKYYRHLYKMSQADLAKALGLSASTISMYEVGEREPNFETEELIADFFNVDLNTLRGKDSESLNLSPAAMQLVESFNQLNEEGQHKLLDYADDLLQSKKYKAHDTASMVAGQ